MERGKLFAQLLLKLLLILQALHQRLALGGRRRQALLGGLADAGQLINLAAPREDAGLRRGHSRAERAIGVADGPVVLAHDRGAGVLRAKNEKRIGIAAQHRVREPPARRRLEARLYLHAREQRRGVRKLVRLRQKGRVNLGEREHAHPLQIPLVDDAGQPLGVGRGLDEQGVHVLAEQHLEVVLNLRVGLDHLRERDRLDAALLELQHQLPRGRGIPFQILLQLLQRL